jgi:hypothetical protein
VQQILCRSDRSIARRSTRGWRAKEIRVGLPIAKVRPHPMQGLHSIVSGRLRIAATLQHGEKCRSCIELQRIRSSSIVILVVAQFVNGNVRVSLFEEWWGAGRTNPSKSLDVPSCWRSHGQALGYLQPGGKKVGKGLGRTCKLQSSRQPTTVEAPKVEIDSTATLRSSWQGQGRSAC